MHVGIYDHFGWAVAVTVADGSSVVDRRRLTLLEPGQPDAPIHHPGSGLDIDGVRALVDRVRASALRATAVSLDALAGTVPAPIRSISLRRCPPDFPTDVAAQLRPPYEARADAIMYRQCIGALARARGWTVHEYDARQVEARARALLGDRAEEVLQGPRARLGPPWTKDHRTALAAVIVASRR